MDWLPEAQWLPSIAPKTNGSLNRHPSILLQVATQFDVEHHPRYLATGSETWCATLVWDITRALACEIPHWWLGKELRANDLIDWLRGDHGMRMGWELCTRPEADAAARAGLPATVGYRNPVDSRPGHMAMVLPPPLWALGTPNEGLTWITQAGGKNIGHGPLESGFGELPVRYFKHC